MLGGGEFGEPVTAVDCVDRHGIGARRQRNLQIFFGARHCARDIKYLAARQHQAKQRHRAKPQRGTHLCSASKTMRVPVRNCRMLVQNPVHLPLRIIAANHFAGGNLTACNQFRQVPARLQCNVAKNTAKFGQKLGHTPFDAQVAAHGIPAVWIIQLVHPALRSNHALPQQTRNSRQCLATLADDG